MPDQLTAPPGAEQPRSTPAHAHGVQIVDTPTVRVHHPSDLLMLVLSALGVAVVMLLAVYAHETTTGVAEDVRGAGSIVRQIFTVPVALLEVLVTFIAPTAVLIELTVRRLGRQVLDATVAALVGLVLAAAVAATVTAVGDDLLVAALSARVRGQTSLTIPAYLVTVTALLTAAGPRARRRTVGWSWNLVWVTLGVALITGAASLPGTGVALLLGRAAGAAVRYVSGVQSERAYGPALVDGVRRAGFDPVRLERVREPETATGPIGTVAPPSALTGAVTPPAPTATRAITRYSDDRVYDLTTTGDGRLTVVVLDGDRQVIGALARLWRSLRLRGIEGRSFVSLRQAAERAALLAYAAHAAGVRTPALLSVAEADDSMLLVQERVDRAVPLRDLDPAWLTDDHLHAVWEQLQLAHDAGITHRALTSDVVLVEDRGAGPLVWITRWENGDVASNQLSRRMDLTQMLALLAIRVGADRALQSAVDVLPGEDVEAIGPLLQTPALPRRTREEVRAHPKVLAELRAALVELLPDADVQPEQLVRFGARTLITILLTVVAVYVVLTTVNVEQITEAVAGSDWRWSLVAFGLGLLTFPGAALAFVAFAPIRLSVWRVTLVQAAGAFVALAAPAGIGPAALNLRMLNRRGVTASLSVATVALVQVSQFVVTVVLLLLLSVISGTSNAPRFTPSPTLLLVIGIVAALVASSFLVPGVRGWVARKTLPTVRQTWPRLIAVVGHPWRVALAVGGNVVMTMGYVLAFEACLAAFGQDLTLVQVALIYLVGNAAGAAVPTPGGIGTIEIALTTGLTAGGLNPGVAASVALLFRVLTYWLRIPVGWLAMRTLQRSGDL
ncbi:lysylphosphatidylglycerol synthase transmembrane domain-containing protein [uncultured Cellulomonas sp.]|uniref:lysylphosphatidylglycerol synthase transmembrane domain-containing protein n=1 Tax=uncultured Cellulomonas sp. TaxID=189682 RepID=UPI002618D92A|nr:lysylphosphatidylglycerol synthase transmembrane domain-containing protein [uncultured Cellulomonas sp.]